MSERPWQDPRFWAEPGADDAREARHAVLADLLAAYVDDELPPETASQLDAHLVGCARCRRDVRLQLAVRGSLAGQVQPAGTDSSGTLSSGTPSSGVVASAALRARVAAITAVAPASPLSDVEPRSSLVRQVVVGAVIALLSLLGLFALSRLATRPAAVSVPAAGAPAASATTVPLIGAALADYRRVVAGDLPGRARDLATVRDAAGLAVEPLRADGLRLIGAWTTELEGEPAAVLAYRWKDRLLVQYIVPEQLFFRSPATRAAAAEHRRLVLGDGPEGIVAWPVAAAGTVLIGEGGPAQVAEAVAP